MLFPANQNIRHSYWFFRQIYLVIDRLSCQIVPENTAVHDLKIQQLEFSSKERVLSYC